MRPATICIGQGNLSSAGRIIPHLLLFVGRTFEDELDVGLESDELLEFVERVS